MHKIKEEQIGSIKDNRKRRKEVLQKEKALATPGYSRKDSAFLELSEAVNCSGQFMEAQQMSTCMFPKNPVLSAMIVVSIYHRTADELAEM